MNAEKKKRNKPLIFALIGAGALVASIGGVFATNSITINSGGTIEFGQGLSSTSTCDAALTTSINQAYNASTGIFDATEVVVSGIKDFACDGKTLHVSLVDGSGVVCGADGNNGSAPNQDSFTIADDGDGIDQDVTKTVTIEANCDASSITKVAITTS